MEVEITESSSQEKSEPFSRAGTNMNELDSFLSRHESEVGESIREGGESNFLSLLEALGRMQEKGKFAGYDDIRWVQLALI